MTSPAHCLTCNGTELWHIPHQPGEIDPDVGSLFVCGDCGDWLRLYPDRLRPLTDGDLREIGKHGRTAAFTVYYMILSRKVKTTMQPIKADRPLLFGLANVLRDLAGSHAKRLGHEKEKAAPVA